MLKSAQREKLIELAHSGASISERRRAQLLLLYDRGLTTREIAKEVDLSTSRVRYWRRVFETKGLNIFLSLSGLEPHLKTIEDTSEIDPTVLYHAELSQPSATAILDGTQKLEEPPSVREEIPFPKPMKSPGIRPDDTLTEAGRKVLRYHFAEMLRHEQGTKLGVDIEALHDMRVAVRHMRVAFEVFRDAFTAKTIKKHNKGLRILGRTLGRVRDLDVAIEKANRYLETLPEEKRSGLDPLYRAWQDQRELARQKMLFLLEGETYHSFLRDFNIFVNTPEAGAKKNINDYHAPHLVRHVAPIMIYQRFGTVRAYEKILGTARIEQLHELRIEFKRLRYTLESFREVLGPKCKRIIEEIKVVQDHLGNLNDANVACQILGNFLEQWELRQQALPLRERENPEPIVAYLASKHAERHQLMITFADTWARFDRQELREDLARAVAAL
jgi:CHAD domain-containing protein